MKSMNTKFHKPLIKTKYNQYSIVYRGPHLWNSLISDTSIDLPFSYFKNVDENRETAFFQCFSLLLLKYFIYKLSFDT